MKIKMDTLASTSDRFINAPMPLIMISEKIDGEHHSQAC